MKSHEARIDMVARVQATFKNWRRFEDMPEIGNAEAMRMSIRADVAAPVTEQHYIEALYNVCARGMPVGRNGNQILGERLA